MPASATASVEYEAGKTGDKVIPFGEITYDKTGTYTYTITEDAAGDGWTTSGSPVTVTVKVTDGGEGKLVAEVTGGGTITNAYKAKEVVVDPTDAKTTFGTKSVTAGGRYANTFNFTLAATSADAPMPETNVAALTYAARATGAQTIPFGEITYDKTGTYTYTITEA